MCNSNCEASLHKANLSIQMSLLPVVSGLDTSECSLWRKDIFHRYIHTSIHRNDFQCQIPCNCNCCIQSQWASASAFQNSLDLPTIRYYLQKIWVKRRNTRFYPWATECNFSPQMISALVLKTSQAYRIQTLSWQRLALSRKAPGPPVPSPCPGLSAYYSQTSSTTIWSSTFPKTSYSVC